jgi:hypothetical protein
MICQTHLLRAEGVEAVRRTAALLPDNASHAVSTLTVSPGIVLVAIYGDLGLTHNPTRIEGHLKLGVFKSRKTALRV